MHRLFSAFLLLFSILCSAEKLSEPAFWTPTPEARALLETMPRNTSAQPGRTRFFIRSQMKYGLERQDFLHGWWDRPLMQDSSLNHYSRPGQWLNRETARIMLQTMESYGVDGIGFFPLTKGRSELFEASLQARSPLLLLTEFAGGNSLSSMTEMAGRTLQTPNSYRIGNKVVLTRYAGKDEAEFARQFKQALLEHHGDRFLYIPYLYLRQPNQDRAFDVPDIRRISRILRSVLRNADGIVLADRLSFHHRRYNRKFNETILYPIVRSIFAEPEFKGKKHLGMLVVTGHENCYRFTYTLDSTGTRMLRDHLESALALQPDFVIMPEWDEQNENTHFRPTIYNSFSTRRIIRAYTDAVKGKKPTLIPGDSIDIPNLIVSYRKNLTAGEPLEIEVVQIPDGTFLNRKFSIRCRLLDLQGRLAGEFPVQTPGGKELLPSCWFKAPASDYLKYQVLRPEITVNWNGGSFTACRGLSPIEIRAVRNTNYKWCKQPFRDLAEADLLLTPLRKNPDGTLVLQGRASSPVPLRSLELLDGSDTVYMAGTLPEHRDSEEQAVIRVTIQGNTHSPLILSGTVTAEDAPSARYYENSGWKAWQAAREGFQASNLRCRHRQARGLISMNRKDAETAVMNIALGPFQKKLPVREILQKGRYALTGPHGSAVMLERELSQFEIPEPLMRKNVEFQVTVRPSDPLRSVFYLRAVDLHYKTVSGGILSLYRPSGQTNELHVFQRDEETVSRLSVDRNLVPDFRYRFSPEYGSLVPCAAGRAAWGILGSYVPLATGVSSGAESREGNPQGKILMPEMPGSAETSPAYVREPDGTFSLQFKPCSHVNFPLHVISVFCGFELTIRIFPEDLSTRRQNLVSSGVNGFNLTMKNGIPEASLFLGNRFYRNPNDFLLTASGSRLRPDSWNTVTVRFSGTGLTVLCNGIPGKTAAGSGYLMLPRWVSLGGNKNTSEFFQGKISGLSIITQ